MRPIGGYFSLEINDGREFHSPLSSEEGKGTRLLRLNAGRYALEYILRARQYRKVYLPLYVCDSVLQPFKQLGVDFEYYHINELLEPAEQLNPKGDEAVLYINYFGLKDRFASTFCYAYPNTILDQTMSFYSRRGNEFNTPGVQCDTFYSCRKFFGVPDGAYLYTDCMLDEELPQDESFDRLSFLAMRVDRSPQEGFADFHHNEEVITEIGMRRMSHMTEAMMKGIDYTSKANRRIHNYQVLDKVLRETNRFKWAMDYGTIPLVYPYFVENGATLRQYLIDHQVFCARYWPNVLEWCKKDDWEYQLAENFVCLPIDQRYTEEDMNSIINIILDYAKR